MNSLNPHENTGLITLPRESRRTEQFKSFWEVQGRRVSQKRPLLPPERVSLSQLALIITRFGRATLVGRNKGRIISGNGRDFPSFPLVCRAALATSETRRHTPAHLHPEETYDADGKMPAYERREMKAQRMCPRTRTALLG